MSREVTTLTEHYCLGCVYYPPNLPPHAYAEADWALLQSMNCSLEHSPGTDDCLCSRKTSCSLVELAPASTRGDSPANQS